MADDAEIMLTMIKVRFRSLRACSAVEDFRLNRRIKRRSRLIEQQNLRLQNESTRNGKALTRPRRADANSETGSRNQGPLHLCTGNAHIHIGKAMDSQWLTAACPRSVVDEESRRDPETPSARAVKFLVAPGSRIAAARNCQTAGFECVQARTCTQKRGFARSGFTDNAEGFALV